MFKYHLSSMPLVVLVFPLMDILCKNWIFKLFKPACFLDIIPAKYQHVNQRQGQGHPAGHWKASLEDSFCHVFFFLLLYANISI